MLFSYKKQIFLYTLLKAGASLFSLLFVKLVPSRAYSLLHACHTFCDKLISFL